MGPPVLFRQRRPGLHERPFVLLKFRTMTETQQADGRLLADTARVTPLGFWLRRFSIDELPQFFNVLRGDMSLVGPRPLLMKYLPYYTPREHTRHLVRPGITGLAQISGRSRLGWEERLELDAHYAETSSLALDLKIFFQTLRQVFYGKDVALDTLPDFDEARAHTTLPE
jgi:lipopolysaccharide/colanic/teichoic acid biosynthesis glycosyltransferase